MQKFGLRYLPPSAAIGLTTEAANAAYCRRYSRAPAIAQITKIMIKSRIREVRSDG
jgi:hypothetical protein